MAIRSQSPMLVVIHVTILFLVLPLREISGQFPFPFFLMNNKTRGYQVGQVISIQFTGERFDRVLVKFSVDKGLELPSNTLAMIQSADLMGSKVVALVPGHTRQEHVVRDSISPLGKHGYTI